MGWKSWVKKAVKKVKKVVKTAVNAVEEVVTDVVETVGNGIEDGLDAVGSALDGIPVIGPALGYVFKWVGGVASALVDLVGSVVKGVLGLVADVICGVVGIVGGIISLQWNLIRDGLLDIVSGIAGAVILILGKFVALLNSIVYVKKRRLTDAEKKLLKRVFWGSIALYNVRIVDNWAGLFDLNSRPFTLGNVIYLKGRSTTSEPDLLVHEAVHVWTYQNIGSRYVSDAIGAQWFVDDEYSWVKELGRGKEGWEEFNREAQASFIEDIYVHGALVQKSVVVASGNGVFFDANEKRFEAQFLHESDSSTPGKENHTALANETVALIRDANAIRVSAFWS